MLVSYKKDNDYESFDAGLHFHDLCKLKNIKTSESCEISYQKGWVELVTSAIIDLENYPIRINMVDDSSGQLDIKFEMLHRKGELTVWRLLDRLKYQSRTICMSCGNSSYKISAIRPGHRLCDICAKLVGKNRQTRTWLDKY